MSGYCNYEIDSDIQNIIKYSRNIQVDVLRKYMV